MTSRSSNSIATLNFPTFLPKSGWLLKISASDMTLLSNRPTKARYVQKCTHQQKWQKWQNFASNNLEANANEKTGGPPCKAGEFGEFNESGKNGKISPTTTWRPMQMRKQEGPLVKPAKFGEFGESGKNGKLVKIADNNLEANANEKTIGPPL